MVIAVYGSRRQGMHAGELQRLLHALTLGGGELVMHGKLYDHLGGELGMSLHGVRPAGPLMPSDAALALSIGGDGTFLRTAAWAGDSETPILGINTGTLGYLSALTVDEAVAHVDGILQGNYAVEPRTLLSVRAEGMRGWPYALNEVVVAKEDTASMIAVDACIDGRPLAEYRADGLIVSTPTGSTAYNLSAGGPVVQPTAPVWTLSPICAHSLGMRPMVVGDENRLQLRVDGRSRAFRLTLDGRSSTLPMGSRVQLERAPFRTMIVQMHGNEFPAALRNKLMFN